MKNFLFSILAVGALSLSIVSCKSDSTSTNNDNNNNNNQTNNSAVNTMTITEGGTTYVLSSTHLCSYSNNTLVLSGTDTVTNGARQVTLTITGGVAAKSYNVGINASSSPTFVSINYGKADGAGQSITYSATGTAPFAGSGSVNITELTAHTCKATFSGTLVGTSSSGGSATISNGSINATF